MNQVDQMRRMWAKARSIHEQQMEKANQLSQVDPAIAREMVESGNGDTDKIQVSKKTIPASRLKPSQTTMVLAKSLGMALFMLKKGQVGGDLGALISADNYIMDGHHRWSAAVLAGGKSAQVGGYMARVRGEDLLKVLNVLTVGKFKRNKGNAGSGSLSGYTPSKTRAMLQKFTVEGIPGQFPWKPEDVKSVLESSFGTVEAGIAEISSNADLITKSVPSWAPARPDMPVINPGEVPAAAKSLQRGEVDWSPDFKKAFREDLTRLAHQHPELRSSLLPVLRGTPSR